MIRRLLVLTALALFGVVLFATVASAHVDLDPGQAVAASTTTASPTTAAPTSSTSTTERALPGTTLEADERDDGTTSAAPWVIGSGLAAIVVVGVGGVVLKRRMS